MIALKNQKSVQSNALHLQLHWGVHKRSSKAPIKGFALICNALANKNLNVPTTPITKGQYVKNVEVLDVYHRSNQDTCLVHKPAVKMGEWVESGDLLADNSASMNGELAIGKNIIVAYMPWEGYNYEDAILINERLVYDDVYTSIHIERYEIETKESQLGTEQITRDIPDVTPQATAHLDAYGIASVGSWIEEGDILVGKVTPIYKKTQTSYQRLLYKLLDKKKNNAEVRDSSLRAPKGLKANVINVQILAAQKKSLLENTKKTAKTAQSKVQSETLHSSKKKLATKTKNVSAKSALPQAWTYDASSGSLTKKSQRIKQMHDIWAKASKTYNTTGPKLVNNAPQGHNLNTSKNNKSSQQNVGLFFKASCFKDAGAKLSLKHLAFRRVYKMNSLDAQRSCAHGPAELAHPIENVRLPGYKESQSKFVVAKPKLFKKSFVSKSDVLKEKIVPTSVHIFLAEKRKIQVGDKMAGRHGNKGIISNILPRQDMPYLPDGTAIDIVLNPLGVPSRMNVGQIYECLLGFAGKYLGEHYKIFPFDEIYGPEASRSFVFAKLFEARQKTGIEWLFDPNSPGKIRIFDGRTAECFDQPVTVGIAYMLKLVHMVDDKIHARSTGPYSLVTQQPLRGRAKRGGQRLGEMEVWAIEGYGAAFVLLEMLTLKSDDMTGRLTLWSNLILNKEITIGTPESFKVLVCELQALCLDIGLFHLESDTKTAELKNGSATQKTGLQSKKNILKEISHLMLLP